MIRLLFRLREAFALWRLVGYDGKPTPWRDAWDLATTLYPSAEEEARRAAVVAETLERVRRKGAES